MALKEENVATEKSLGIIKPDLGSLKFKARKLNPGSQEAQELQGAFHQVSLLDANPLTKLVVDYEFSYRFTCGGHPHEMKIHDWEVQSAWHHFKIRYRDDAMKMLVNQYQERVPEQNLHFVMGTMKAHPRQFIVIGLLRSSIQPSDVAKQPGLF